MILADVYETPGAVGILYLLLGERGPAVSISHKAMPSFAGHTRFVLSQPYAAWYLIEVDGETVGSVYLTKEDEIGIHLFAAHQGKGFGPEAVKQLMATHRRARYLANVNPLNERSAAMFRELGFSKIQETYALER